jgi:transcriptional regulator with XRE-family HTH domain
MSNALGEYLRKCRTEKQLREGNAFSLRQLAGRIGVEPSYLSKIERGLEPRPSEETTRALALALGEDPDILLAMAGKVSGDLQEIIRKRPQLFAQVIRELKKMPNHAVLRLVREVRDGNW